MEFLQVLGFDICVSVHSKLLVREVRPQIIKSDKHNRAVIVRAASYYRVLDTLANIVLIILMAFPSGGKGCVDGKMQLMQGQENLLRALQQGQKNTSVLLDEKGPILSIMFSILNVYHVLAFNM